MPNRPATVEVNISNLSLPLPVLALGSIGDYERYLRSITPSGHDRAPGIEYTTVKSRFGHQLGKLAQIDRGVSPNGKPHTPEEELVARMVRSLHLSFRDESPRGGPAD